MTSYNANLKCQGYQFLDLLIINHSLRSTKIRPSTYSKLPPESVIDTVFNQQSKSNKSISYINIYIYTYAPIPDMLEFKYVKYFIGYFKDLHPPKNKKIPSLTVAPDQTNPSKSRHLVSSRLCNEVSQVTSAQICVVCRWEI